MFTLSLKKKMLKRLSSWVMIRKPLISARMEKIVKIRMMKTILLTLLMSRKSSKMTFKRRTIRIILTIASMKMILSLFGAIREMMMRSRLLRLRR